MAEEAKKEPMFTPGQLATGVGGLAFTGLGALAQHRAGRSREKAFNSAITTRSEDQAGLQNRRSEGLERFNTGLSRVGGQQQAAQLQGLQGLAGLGGVFDSAQAQGLQDIQGGRDQIFQQAPVGGAFSQGANMGPSAGVLERIQAQQQPGLQAQNNLGAAGLGRIAMGREQGNVMHQQGLGLAGAQRSMGALQRGNALNEANISLDDLRSQMRFQRAREGAGRTGMNTQAIGGLVSQIGGGMLGAGLG